MNRPDPSEYPAVYAPYIDLVPDGDIVHILRSQIEDTLALLGGIPEERADHRYAAGKWSIKELVGHLVDSERIFGCRGLVFARGDSTPWPGFEQDDYVHNAGFERRRLADLALELQHLRASHVVLFASLDSVQTRTGTACGQEFSVRSVPYLVAAHERHHVSVLRERYL